MNNVHVVYTETEKTGRKLVIEFSETDPTIIAKLISKTRACLLKEGIMVSLPENASSLLEEDY